jgi:hypothetical protein
MYTNYINILKNILTSNKYLIKGNICIECLHGKNNAKINGPQKHI